MSAVPAVAILNYTDAGKKRYECLIDDERVDLERVTSLLNGQPKDGLRFAHVYGAIDAALDRSDTFAADVAEDRGQVRKELYGAVFDKWEVRQKVGTAVHRQIEARILGSRPPMIPNDVDGVEVAEHLAQFDLFCADFSPEWEASEMTVINLTHKYAGTLDAIAVLQTDNGPRRLLVDIKTTRREKKRDGSPGGPGIYLDQACQMAAYINAEWAVDQKAGIVEPVPSVDGAAILWINRDGYALVEMDVSERVWELFLAGAYVYRTQGDKTKSADGEYGKWWKIAELRGGNG